MLVAILAVLLLGAVDVEAQIRLRRAPVVVEEPSGSAYDDGTHPSMLINSYNKAAIQARLASSGNAADHARFDAMVDYVDANWDTIDDAYSGTTAMLSLMVATIYATCNASCNLLDVEYTHTKAEYGAKAKVLLDLILNASGSAQDKLSHVNSGYWQCLAFDMVYDQFTGGEVAQYKDMWDGIDVHDQADLTNSYSVFHRVAQLVCGAALGETDAWGLAHVNAFTTKFRSATGATNFTSVFSGGGGGDWPEGPSYMWSYYWAPLIVAEEAYRTMKGISKATHYETSQTDALTKHPLWAVYNEEPWENVSGDPGGRAYVYYTSFKKTAGDQHKMSQSGLGFRDAFRWVQAITEGTTLAAYGRLARWWEVNRSGSAATTGAEAVTSSALWLLIAPTTVPTAESPTTQAIPLRALAGQSQVVYRTDWTTANAPVVRINSHAYTGDEGTYRDANPGGLWVGRQGPMLTKKYSQGGHGAANSGAAGTQSAMMFVDRVGQDRQTAENDSAGGARRPVTYPLDSTADLTSTDQIGLSDRRLWFANGSTRTINYVGQSLCESYDSAVNPQANNPNRCTAYYDHKFYLEPADADADPVLVVQLARIRTASTNIVPTLPFHIGGGSPTVTGATSTTAFARYPADGCSSYAAWWTSEPVAVTCASSGTSGWTRYIDPTSIQDAQTYNGMSGQTTVTVLQPSGTGERTLERCGGPDDAANDWDNNATSLKSFEHCDPYGAQFAPAQDTGMQEAYSGGGGPGTSAYTFYLSKTTQTTGDQWFNLVYEVGDNASTPVACVELTNGAGDNDFFGTKCGTRFVVAGEDGDSKTSGDVIFPDTTVTYTGGLFCGLEKSANATFTVGSSITSFDSEGDTDGTVAVGASGCVPMTFTVTSGGAASTRTVTVS